VLLVPLLADVFRAGRPDRWRNSPSLFFACWVILPLVFFSFSQSKLPGYILPSVPPLVLLLAASLAGRLSQDRFSSRIWLLLVACTLPLLSLPVPYWLRRLPADSGLRSVSAWTGLLAVMAAGGVVSAWLAWTRRERAAIAGVALSMAAVVVVASVTELPRLDPAISSRAAARITEQAAGQAAPVYVEGVDRSMQYGLEYYLDRPVPELSSQVSRPAWVWTNARQAGLMQISGQRLTVINKLNQQAWLVRIDPPANP
jgi:4-amino-4-deoxy-L-arabinose transferase-like glycosyltransferase